MKPLLWFLSVGMTLAFVNLAYMHKTPTEALVLGLAVGAVSTATTWGVFTRMRRHLAGLLKSRP